MEENEGPLLSDGIPRGLGVNRGKQDRRKLLREPPLCNKFHDFDSTMHDDCVPV